MAKILQKTAREGRGAGSVLLAGTVGALSLGTIGTEAGGNHDDDGKEEPEPDAHDVKTALTKKLRICHPDKQTRGGLTEEAATMATVALLKAHETVCAFLFHGGD